jgi:hypothetical protein
MSRHQFIGVGILAAGALLLESTLTRLLAVAQFYHFAFLVISLALLGLEQRFDPNFATALLEGDRQEGRPSPAGTRTWFSLSVLAARGGQSRPVRQLTHRLGPPPGILLILYYFSSLPFILLGSGSAARLWPGKKPQIYASNLPARRWGTAGACTALAGRVPGRCWVALYPVPCVITDLPQGGQIYA